MVAASIAIQGLALEAGGLSNAGFPGADPIHLSVDLRDAPRRRFQVRESLPVQPGPLRLVYPKWIPGEHGPTGPINAITGLHFRAGARELDWHRDPTDMYAIEVTVPEGSSRLELEFQYLPVGEGQFGAAASTTPYLAELEWNQVIWYPQGRPVSEIPVQAEAQLPEGWHYATALEADAQGQAGALRFRPVSLETLVDAPLFCGRYSQLVDLAPGAPHAIRLNVFADDAVSAEVSEAQVEKLRALAVQIQRLTGAIHFQHYDMLLGLSDDTAHFGLEHHQSSDDRVDLDYLSDSDVWLANASLLPHEWFHSWNGKFRRPAGLATPDYQQPMDGRLLWVYEGLTNYYGEVLAARAGMQTAEDWRGQVALTAATMRAQAGRTWRPLQDTATAAQLLYDSPKAYSSWRREVDFYPEGSLLWLAVDVELRQRSGGRKSLDDFVRAFHGIHPGRVEVLPYDFQDVVATLQSLVPGDWAARLRGFLDGKSDQPPLSGIHDGGWELGFSDKPDSYFSAAEKSGKHVNAAFDIGLVIDNDKGHGSPGKLLDVIWGGPAFQAGVAPGATLVAVDGIAYTPELLRQAISRAAKPGTAPIQLLLRDGDTYLTIAVDYHGGLRYPQLVRRAGSTDLLKGVSDPR